MPFLNPCWCGSDAFGTPPAAICLRHTGLAVDNAYDQSAHVTERNTLVKRKNLIELPKQDDNFPAGFFSIEVGDSRLLLDAEGNEKPPAEVRTMKRRKKGSSPRKQKSPT